ncbi:hypothetical protein AVEN_174495-1 [Araneus ventricosus]|uniref:Uncharacterized protein n=1 Tax=Araneus ventricosus TaxID=182803 RepID=A0A4Y2WYK2_ARAVE|nr:hypothetical protein AVEN_65610-1 [Araneus ventricosus]GBO41605.1 hypothetical protein AVEN_174495-1 [Araneus ventricosus]
MANSGSGGVVQCFGPLDRQTSLALTTSYGGYVKSLVYKTPVNSAGDLFARIAAAAGNVRDTPGIFANVQSSMRRRCEACITARGRNFEHLL